MTELLHVLGEKTLFEMENLTKCKSTDIAFQSAHIGHFLDE